VADSLFDEIMRDAAIPALEAVFGVAATHVGASGETAVTVLRQTDLAAVGEYGERMEERTTLELAKSWGARVGDSFELEGPTIYRAAQLMADDGYLRKFAVLAADQLLSDAGVILLWDDGATALLWD